MSHSKKVSPTEAGPTEQTEHNLDKDALIDTINQVFSLFKINYGNQYYAAFREQALEIQAKRLWFDSLKHFPSQAILAATKAVILESEYLPTLSKMVAQCEKHSNAALPEPRTAYVEACQAPSPKAGHQWSHPAVYYAGLACDWFFLASTPESNALPVFKQHYREICERVRNGEELKTPKLKELPSPQESVLTREENQQRLAELRAQLDL